MKVYRNSLTAVTVLLLLGMMFSVLPIAPLTHAQDGGLTDEQMALLDRVYDAVENRDSYTSFNLGVQETRNQTMDISVGGQSMARSMSSFFKARLSFSQSIISLAVLPLMVAIKSNPTSSAR